jgi:hypothetical protein
MYLKKKLDVNQRIRSLYADQKYRQYKWYGYLNRMRSEAQLINHFRSHVESEIHNAVAFNPHKHRQKKKKNRIIRSQIKKIKEMDKKTTKINRRDKHLQRKENRSRSRILRLKKELGIGKSTKHHLCLKNSPVYEEDIAIILSKDESILRLDQEIKTCEKGLPELKQNIWALKKSICQLKMALSPSVVSQPKQPIEKQPNHITDSKIIIIIGDWSVGKQMRGMISTPNMRLKRQLAKFFVLFLIDEFRTSCLHWLTEQRCENLELPDATGKIHKIHSVLTYQTETNWSGCINRDNNACRNIRKLFREYLKTGGRPVRYQRGVEL